MLENDNSIEHTISRRSSENFDIESKANNKAFEISRVDRIKSILAGSFSSGSDEAGFASITIASVGMGMLLLPGASTYSGLIWSIVQLIICSLISYYASLLLITCAVKRRVCSYQELAEQTYGRSFRWLINVTIFIANGALVVFYFKTVSLFSILCSITKISSLLANFVQAVTSNPNTWVAGPGQKVIPILIATFFVLPVSLPKRLRQLRYLWAINLLFILFICGVIVQQSLLYQEISNSPKKLLLINFSGFAKTFPSIIFALYHYNSLDVFGDLTSFSKRIMKRVIKYNKIFVFVLYLLMITFGYITFTNSDLMQPEYINQVILIDYIFRPDEKIQTSLTIIAASFLLMIFILSTKMPVFVIPAKDGIQDFFFPKKADRYGQPFDPLIPPYLHFIFVATTIYAAAGISCFIQDQSIIQIINLISSIWVIHCFIVPAAFYINLPKNEQKYKHEKLSKLLILIMTGFAIYNTYTNVADMF